MGYYFQGDNFWRGYKIRGGIIFGGMAHIDVIFIEGYKKVDGLDEGLNKGIKGDKSGG
jgi:hypothetical protein